MPLASLAGDGFPNPALVGRVQRSGIYFSYASSKDGQAHRARLKDRFRESSRYLAGSQGWAQSTTGILSNCHTKATSYKITILQDMARDENIMKAHDLSGLYRVTNR